MKWCVTFLLISIFLFIVVVAVTPPIPQHIFAAMDLGRRVGAQPAQGTMQMTIVSTREPLIMIRRPFHGIVARTLLLANLPSTILAIAVSFLLRSTTLSSKLISDVVAAVFIVGVIAQWLGIGAIVSRAVRRSRRSSWVQV